MKYNITYCQVSESSQPTLNMFETNLPRKLTIPNTRRLNKYNLLLEKCMLFKTPTVYLIESRFVIISEPQISQLYINIIFLFY